MSSSNSLSVAPAGLTHLEAPSSSPAFPLFAVVHALALVGSAYGAETPTPSPSPGSQKPPQDATHLDTLHVTGEAAPYQPTAMSSSRYTAPLRDTPQTVTVIPKALIEDQNATSLRDVLRNVPGISFQAGEGGVPAGDQLTVRGFSARTDLFVDGIRDFGGYTRDPFNLEQVEVTQGPGSTYSGRGSTGGSINIATKSPKLESFYESNVGVGSDDYFRSTIDINQRLPDSAALPGVAFRLNGVYHTQDFANRDYVHNERWGVAPSIAFGLNTPTTAVLSYLHFEENNLPSYGVPFVTNPINPFGGDPAVGKPAPVANKTFYGLLNRDYEDITNDIATLRVEHTFDDTSRLETTARYGRTFRDSIVAAPRIFSASPEDSITRELQARYQLDEIIASQTTYTAQFETFHLKHSFAASFDYSHETEKNDLRANSEIAQRGDAFDPNPYDPIGVFGFTGAKNESSSDSAGLAVFDAIAISEQWILNLGARYDYFDATYDQTAVDQTVTTFNTTDEVPTWRAGLVYKPLPNGSVYFNYGTSFNPSAEGLTLSAANVNLDPETSESFELGTKWGFFDEKLTFTGAIFRTDKSNYRTTDPVTAIVTTSGEVRVQGIQFGVAGNITKDWSIFGGYTYLDSEILSSTTVSNGLAEEGRELSNTPHHTGSLWTTYKLPWHLQIGSGVQYVDERFANNVNDRQVEGYWLQDAMISWQPNKNVTVQINVTNLWNEEYIDRVGGGHAIPGSGRSIVLSTGLRF